MKKYLALIGLLVAMVAGCSSSRSFERGAQGAALGAGVGYLAGKGAGAIAGGLIGGAVGSIVGDMETTRTASRRVYAAPSPLSQLREEKVAVIIVRGWTGADVVRSEIEKGLREHQAIVVTDVKSAAYKAEVALDDNSEHVVVHIRIIRIADAVLCGSGSGWSARYYGYSNDLRPFAFAAWRAITCLR